MIYCFRVLAVAGLLAVGAVLATGCTQQGKVDTITVKSRASLLHLGSPDSFDVTDGGTAAAKLLLQAIDKNDLVAAKQASDTYEQLIPGENFGGEYGALQWIADYMLLPPAKQKEVLADPLIASFFEYWAKDNWQTLRQYLHRKYHLHKYGDEDSMLARHHLRLWEDFILFNNPRRERWEKSSKIIETLNLKPGQTVADIGSGPGFFSYKFAQLVGPTGKVYAIDTVDEHLKYVTDTAKKVNLNNIETATASMTSVGLGDKKVDVAYMCSLYHVVYTLFTEEEKDAFVMSIRNCLKPGGKFVVVDNAFIDNETLPYHGPYMAKELIIAQLKYYGFELVDTQQFIPQRYILTFKVGAIPVAGEKPKGLPANVVALNTKKSLLHLPNHAAPDVTTDGRKAARLFYKAITTKDAAEAKASAAAAIPIYQRIIPKERFGDEYTAFMWFCQTIAATDAERQKMLESPYIADYYQYLTGNNWEVLRRYIDARYHLDLPDELTKRETPEEREERMKKANQGKKEEVTEDQMSFWRDFILFNNPNRELWEKTSFIVEAAGIKPGDRVADLGSGPGYYTFKFAKLAGDKGKVYAIDTNKDHLDYVTKLSQKHFPNVECVYNKLNDICMPESSVDKVFICSLYDVIYSTSMEMVKDELVASIRKALRKGGQLIIVDNDVVPEGTIPYHGPYIERSLIISQMQFYGFKLVSQHQKIPQRYVLVFEMVDLPARK